MQKVCRKCFNEKSFVEYRPQKRGKNGLRSWCRECEKQYNKNLRRTDIQKYRQRDKLKGRKFRNKNREKINIEAKERRRTNPEAMRNTDLKKNYGITLQRYNEMFQNQEGSCCICKKHQNEFSKRLSVDHCHKTGKVRGLLCNNCNLAIGLFDEDLNVIKNTIYYLEKHR